MPAPRYRSRTLRRIRVKTPGGRNVIHYRKRKPSPASCARCNNTLKGVPRVRARQLSRLAKTEKRPQRLHGGMLCSRCSREDIRAQARSA